MNIQDKIKSISEYSSIDDVIEKAKESLNVPFKVYDKKNRLSTRSKGNLGNIVEEGLFGYPLNSDQEPDFPHLGLELKVTPFKYNNNHQVAAKERLVLTMINYMEDYNVSFEDSKCFHKINKVLMLFYNHDTSLPKTDYFISKIYLYLFDYLPEKDKLIIKKDYETIINKIKSGHAEDISEADTFYLGACTKGATAASSYREQPFSDIKAKKRAFSLKSSYMTQLLRSDVFNKNAITEESLITDLKELTTSTIGDIIERKLNTYKDKTLSEIDKSLETKVKRSSKSYLRTYISRMLKSSIDNADNLEEFKKANIKIKTLRINRNGKIRESMSFPNFKFTELVKQDWFDSDLRNQFVNEKYLFCVFEEIDDSKHEYVFKNAFMWFMPENILDNQVKYVWEDTKKKAIEGIRLTPKKQQSGKIVIENNLIKKSDNMIVHVRPHTANSYHRINGVSYGKGSPNTDGDILPNGDIITKQSFWINNDFIINIININKKSKSIKF